MEKNCIYCRVPMILDAWDHIEEQENGDFLMDAFEAWVCPNSCGYYEKAETDPIRIQKAELHIWWKIERKK